MMNIFKVNLLKSAMAGVLIVGFTACGGGGEQNPENNPKSYKENKAAEETVVEETATEETAVAENYNLGIGPVTEKLELGGIDEALATEGADIFTAKCTACHKIDSRLVGPALAGVTERRTPEWIMNMILNPDEMTKSDPIGMELIAEYVAPMLDQNLEVTEARALLEYFRQYDQM